MKQTILPFITIKRFSRNSFLILSMLFALLSSTNAQSFCPGNLVSNPQFTANMTGWSQYGLVPNATVLNIVSGCLNKCLIMQATTNSNCGVTQPVIFRKDSCYSLCYCVEFPGGGFNAKLTIAAITSGVTVTQLLTGAFTPAQAKIIDVVSATNGFPSYNRCPSSFSAAGNYTDFVVVNETIGPYGSDVRVDNICLVPGPCPPVCSNVNAYFSYTVGAGNSVTFTDNSTSNPGDVLSWLWNFGDPASGVNNTSTAQNPTHIFTSPGAYIVCLYLHSNMTNGLSCTDTLCMDITVTPVGIIEQSDTRLTITPNPAKDFLYIGGTANADKLVLYNLYGQIVFESTLPASTIYLPSKLSSGIYCAEVNTREGKLFTKVMIIR